MNRKRSLLDVERHVRLHLGPFFGRRRLAAITTADVRRYVLRRQEEGARNATINRELSVLKRAFMLAIAAGTLASRPHIALLREDNVRRGFFEAEDFEAVRRRLSPDLADFVSFLYTTGWRWRSEAARRRWTNVAFDAGEVRLEPGTTKTGEGRVFPFTADLRALFERRRAVARERERELGRVIPHVFTRPNGAPIGSFNKAWATACRAAGVPGRSSMISAGPPSATSSAPASSSASRCSWSAGGRARCSTAITSSTRAISSTPRGSSTRPGRGSPLRWPRCLCLRAPGGVA